MRIKCTLSSRVSAGATTPRQVMVVVPCPQTDTRVSSSMSARPMDLKKDPFPRWLPMLRNRRTEAATLLCVIVLESVSIHIVEYFLGENSREFAFPKRESGRIRGDDGVVVRGGELLALERARAQGGRRRKKQDVQRVPPTTVRPRLCLDTHPVQVCTGFV